MINMSNWSFSVGGSHVALVAAGLAPPATQHNYPTHIDLLLDLSTGISLPAGQVDARLIADVKALGWPKVYSRLNKLTHFPRYRSKSYDTYKSAALAVAAGTANAVQTALVNGLSQEIQSSAVVVPAGQVVFHGRSDTTPSSSASTYPSFLSTTLNPFVARQSARRRTLQLGGRDVIYAFTLRNDLPALWGHVGRSGEWELLLDANLPIRQTATHAGTAFDIVEAEIG